jgi:hypothetical protein
MSHLNSRVARVVAGLAVASAFAVVPMAAQAADTNATGTLSAGSLTNSAPAITPFEATLTGLAQAVNTPVGTWGVTDATGSNAGYSVTVSATAPTVDADGTGGVSSPVVIAGSTLKLYTTEAQAADGNANTAPVAAVAQQLDVDGTPAASTIQNAPAGTGQGPWNFAADEDVAAGLEVVVPGTATPGAYSSTLTYTTAVPLS